MILMKKVYLVTSGCYSDYSVDAVFSTREKAQDFICTYGADNFDIEEFDLDKYQRNEKGSLFRVSIYSHDSSLQARSPLMSEETKEGLRCFGYQPVQFYELITRAKDSTAAVKKAADLRREILAMNAWGKGPEELKEILKK